MSSRRPILKRISVWTAAVVLVIVMYLAGAPLVVGIVGTRFPSSRTVLGIVYLPALWYCNKSGWPGSDAYDEYARWCISKVVPPRPIILAPPSQKTPAP